MKEKKRFKNRINAHACKDYKRNNLAQKDIETM